MGIKSLRSIAVAGVTAGLALAVLPGLAAGGAVAATNAANHVITHVGHTKSVFQSSNWSGYAKTGTFTSVSGHWTVPTVSGTGNHFSSQWAGIDGFNNSNLIQTGTEADVIGGRASYDAWWEILPAPETVITGMTIHPGDSMTATITKVSGTTWNIRLTDNTTGVQFNSNKTYRGAGTSAEWIEEATEVNGTIGTPPRFTTFTFNSLTANGVNPNLTTAQEILLVQGTTTYSTPSAPVGGNSFSVTYTGP
ncbi:MAG TPA: G1 family glutamic endopeptidase [Pseudonocardiaceae bacterium]|nr:G1 family glutamic endopeptidase [Pseudonocardiaceae bacterium]